MWKKSDFFCRLGQILNLYWEKTDEAAMSEAVSRALLRMPRDGVRLVDFTTTEDICVPQLSTVVKRSKKHYVLFVELEGPNGEEITLTEAEKEKVGLRMTISTRTTVNH